MGEEPVASEQKVKIDTTRGWADTGIDVIAGQHLQIVASGEHCLPGGRCMGPEGAATIALHGARPDGSAASIHGGQLGAVLGDEVVPVGRSTSFITKTSGRLLLGVASKASSGSRTATVRLFYPLRNR